MRIEAIPAFQDNYIWLLRQGGDAVVVDPGAASPVLHRLAQRREGSHKLKMHKATVAAG